MASIINFPLIFVLVTAVGCFVVGEVNGSCSVTIQNGTILGQTADTVDPSRKACVYLGIPFASPPERFKPPQPATGWEGPLNATKSPNWCPQAGTPPEGIEISEDCLYLNVYHPELEDPSNASLPVMIWFHGGSFINSGSLHFYTPLRLLARGDVVLVVVHYRLGSIGFLSTGDEASPGNYGLKDQALSIKWVHENIKAFGGNLEKVTIFGESAGGVAVAYQMLSPVNKGLIHRVIGQSGWALTSNDPHPLESAKEMASHFDCSTNSSSEIVECLSKISWEEIIEAQSLVSGTKSPVVEPNIPGAFITEEPAEIMKTGEFDKIPVMLGANRHEGSFVLAGAYISYIGPLGLDKNPEHMRNDLVPDLLRMFFGIQGDEANRAVASTVEMAYLSGVNRSSWNESVPGLVDFLGSFYFKSPIEVSAKLLSKRGLDVYLYTFDHGSDNSVFEFLFPSVDLPIEHGVTHGDDLIYLFDYPGSSFSPADQEVSEKMCDMWINFASSGNPTPSPSDRYEEWPTYDEENESYMKLNVTPSVHSGYRNSWRPNGFKWN